MAPVKYFDLDKPVKPTSQLEPVETETADDVISAFDPP